MRASLLLLVAGVPSAAPGAAAQHDAAGIGAPYRVERFASTKPAPGAQSAPAPTNASGPGTLAGALGPTVSIAAGAPGPYAVQEPGAVDASRVAWGTVLAGVGSWLVVAYVGIEATAGYYGLYYAAPVSIVTSALTAHALSEGRGEIALSLGVSAALTALLAAGFEEFWTFFGPAVAIPISVAVETQ